MQGVHVVPAGYMGYGLHRGYRGYKVLKVQVVAGYRE